MNENKFRLTREPALSVPVSDAEKLLQNADGNAALLYLYMLKTGGELEPSQAAEALKRTRHEIENAAERLKLLGLLMQKSPKIRPAPEPPDYSAEELSKRTACNPGFQAVVSETQSLYGRMLSGGELRSLFAVYDYLSLPAEVMLMLIHHCIQEYRSKNGEGRLPGIRVIEKEAYIWSDREIITLERAEEYIRRQKQRGAMISKIKDALQIRGRDLSVTESEYVNSWMDMGFETEALAVAYDKTVVQTGKLVWKYMDSILKNWHSKGVHRPEEIVNMNSYKQAEPVKAVHKQSSGNAGELERMKRLLERIKND